ncbi:MAG: hypothetical protein BGO57_11950 [Sphingomonadales bacterium 63-6]|nr:MAG: hypothetical protein BGO57_11950 [Sphingomonadales bacterium 63-6]
MRVITIRRVFQPFFADFLCPECHLPICTVMQAVAAPGQAADADGKGPRQSGGGKAVHRAG